MATKKTPAKKAPAKKTKPASKVEHRSDYKPGTRVKVTRRDNTESKGFVTKVFKTPTGPFIRVNIGTKDVVIEKDFRPAKVRGY